MPASCQCNFDTPQQQSQSSATSQSDAGIDEDEEYKRLDPVQEQKFYTECPTLFINDFLELDVREPPIGGANPNSCVVVAPGENKTPSNILKATHWGLQSFPCLQLEGKDGLHPERHTNLSMQQYFQQRLLNVDRRFANNPSYAFVAFACNELNTLEGKIISFMCGKKSTSSTGGTKYSLGDLYIVLDKSPGTPNIFKQKRFELIARLENISSFVLFFTLSCGEKRYNENFSFSER